MKKKTISRFILYIFLIFGVLGASVIVFLNTSWGQKKLLHVLTRVIQKNGIVFAAEKIDVPRPWTFHLTNVRINQANKTIFLSELEAQVRLLPLLWKELSLKNVLGNDISFVEEKVSAPSVAPKKIQEFMGKFSIESFSLHNLHLSPKVTLHITGNGYLHSHTLFLKSHITQEGIANSYVDVDTKLHKNTLVFLKASGMFTTLRGIPYALPIDGEGKFSLEIKEPWEDHFVPGKNSWDGKVEASLENITLPSSLQNWEKWGKSTQFSSRFSIQPGGTVKISFFSLINPLVTCTGQGNLDKNFLIDNMKFSYKIPSLEPIGSIKGSLSGHGNIEQKNHHLGMLLDYRIDAFSIAEAFEIPIQGSIQSVIDKEKVSGSFYARSLMNEKNAPTTPTPPVDLRFDFDWNFSEELNISHLLLSHPSTKVEGELKVLPGPLLEGMLKTSINSPELLHAFIPSLEYSGKIEGKSLFSKDGKNQNFLLMASLKNVEKKPFYVKEGNLSLHIKDLLHNPKGVLSIDGKDLHIYPFQWKIFSFQTSNIQKQFPFSIHAEGSPSSLDVEGFWTKEKKTFQVQIQKLSGSWEKFAFSNDSPFSVSWNSSQQFSVKKLSLSATNAHATFQILKKPHSLSLNIESQNFPFHLLFSPIPPSLQTNLSIQFSQKKKSPKGKASLMATYEKDQKITKATIECLIQNSLLQSEIHVVSQNQTEFQTKVTLPLDIELFPWKLTVYPERPIEGHIALKGKIEDFLHLVDTGSHKLEGNLSGNLTFSQTLSQPKMDGSLEFTSGTYENFFTSSYFTDIKASLSPDKNGLKMLFYSTDGMQGIFQGDGFLELDGVKKFPYSLHTTLTNFFLVRSDLISANAAGFLHISGNQQEASMEGKIHITKADMRIPEKLPFSIPSLPVTFIGPPPPTSIQETPQTRYPIHVHLEVSAPDSITLEGRGLHSKWTGAFSVQGLYNEPIFSGEIKMKEGSFDFAGKSFELTDGSLQFIEKPRAYPLLSLQGQLKQKSVTIITYLHGPINAPELTFQSIPPLAPSSILSLLVFGQDLSDISGVQALQLIATAGTVSAGPNLMEILRKNLGVDKLSFVSSPTKKIDNPDKVALHVGKYIIRGVLVTFSQGLEEGSSNVIVEADLTHGFIFQAETQQEEEQGKFTLKWNKNY